jgi:DNA primase
MNTLDDVAARLQGVRRNGDGFMALCPAHGDTNPSLQVWTDKEGDVAFCCSGGCEYAKVREALEALGLDVGRPKHEDYPSTYKVRDTGETLPIIANDRGRP